MVFDRFPDANPNRRIGFHPAPVLVVDDHPANRWVLGKLLERLGIDSRFASDGTEAIAIARMRRWGAFLMDIEMRRLDGDQAARQLRRLSPDLARAPIIAVTSLSVPEARKRCRRAGIDGLVSKPVSIIALEEQLRAHAGHLFVDSRSAIRDDLFRTDLQRQGRLKHKPPGRPSKPRRDQSSDRSSEGVG